MAHEIAFYRCDVDGRLTALDTDAKLRAHLGHPLRTVYPRWWERLLIYAGWRP